MTFYEDTTKSNLTHIKMLSIKLQPLLATKKADGHTVIPSK